MSYVSWGTRDSKGCSVGKWDGNSNGPQQPAITGRALAGLGAEESCRAAALLCLR